MKQLNLFFKEHVPASLLPLALAGFTCLLAKYNPFPQAQVQEGNPSNFLTKLLPPQNQYQESSNLFVSFSETLSNSYLSFLMVLTSLHIIIQLSCSFVKNLKKLKSLPPAVAAAEDDVLSTNHKTLFNQLTDIVICLSKLILYYTLIFCVTHSLLFIISSFFSVSEIPVHPVQESIPHRKLEQQNEESAPFSTIIPSEESNSHRMLIPQEPYYGKILFETFVGLYQRVGVTPQDGKISFLSDPDTLFIVDISKPAQPITLSTFIFYKSSSDDQYYESTDLYPTMAVSNDKTLCAMYFDRNLFLINTTDLSAPKLTSHLKLAKDKTRRSYFGRRTHPSIALTADSRYLFLTDSDLRIFDLSNPLSVDPIVHIGIKTTTITLLSNDKYALIGGEGSLMVYDISNIASPTLIGSMPMKKYSISAILSSDPQLAYILTHYSPDGKDFALEFLVVSLKDLTNPTALRTLYLGDRYSYPLFWISPDERFLFVNDNGMRMVDLVSFNTYTFPMTLFGIASYHHMSFSPDVKYAMVFSGGRYFYVELNIDLDYQPFANLQPNIIGQFKIDAPFIHDIEITEDKKAYIISGSGTSKYGKNFKLSIADWSDLSQVKISSFFDAGYANLLTLSTDGKKIYYRSNKKIISVIDTQTMTNLQNINLPEVISEVWPDTGIESLFVISPDQKILYAITEHFEIDIDFLIIDISDPVSTKIISRLTLPDLSDPLKFNTGLINMMMDFKSKTLFYVEKNLYIIDVSDEFNPKLLKTFVMDKVYVTHSFAMTSDFRSAFILATFEGEYRIMVVDLADVKNPKLVTSLFFQPLQSTDILHLQMKISKDNQKLFLNNGDFLIVYNITNFSAPKMIEPLKFNPFTYEFSSDDQYIFMSSRGEISIAKSKPKYLFNISNPNLSIGVSYPTKLRISQLNSYNQYGTIHEKYKLIKTSSYSIGFELRAREVISFSPLPSWMIFDKENARMVFDLNSQIPVGSYPIYGSLSLEVLESKFYDVTPTLNKTESFALYIHLIGQGYLDVDSYLTPDFDPQVPLKIHPMYQNLEMTVRNHLSKHFFEITTQVNVLPSLRLLEGQEHFNITTPSANSLSVEIELFPYYDFHLCKFAKKSYAGVKTTFNEENSILLEGSLLHINEALSHIIINVEENYVASCEGRIIVNDDLNPTINRTYSEISDFFNINDYPTMNEDLTVQSQVSQVIVYSDQHFIIELDSETFKDSFGQALEYSLTMPNHEVSSYTWLNLRGLSLMGTPPDQFWPYKIEVAIRAKNQFKDIYVPFTLEIRLSFVTIMKRLMLLVTYLFSAYKFWQHSDKIYNVVYQKSYRHPRDLNIKVAQEISDQIITPIIFIDRKSENSSLLILQKLEKYVEKELALKSGTVNQAKVIDYFTDLKTSQIGKPRIAKAIENIIYGIFDSKTNILKLYSQGEIFDKRLLIKLVTNNLIFKRLSLSSEKATQQVFERIKYNWAGLVLNTKDPYEFPIHNANLFLTLRRLGLEPQEIASADPELSIADYSIDNQLVDMSSMSQSTFGYSQLTSSNSPTQKRSIEKEFIISAELKKKINFGLLKDVISAHAFQNHNIPCERYSVVISLKEQELDNQTSWDRVKKFLKFNLRDLVFASQKNLGYGLKYKLVRNVLHFYGVPSIDIKGKTLVIQIVSKKGWILKELYLINEEESFDEKDMMDNVQDQL